LVAFLKTVGQLPLQFWYVLFFPSVKTLSVAERKARWSLVIILLLLLIAMTILLNTLGHHIPGAALHSVAALNVSGISIFGWLPPPLNMIVFLLATFSIGLFTAYPFSKLASATGTFLAHIYLLLLFTVPLVTISGLLLLIPTTGSTVFVLLNLVGALFLYRLVLHGMTISAVHLLPAGKATLIVLIIPMILVFLLVIIGLAHLDIPEIGDLDIPFGQVSQKKDRKKLRRQD
jgi:hypothetical protein